jgi:hypothetical protein
MANSRRQSRSILGLAALLSLLLVQTAFSLPQPRINLSPHTLYHHLGSTVGAVLSRSRHFADDFQLLYELHQLASGPPQSERSVPVSRSSAPSSPTQETLCERRAIPAPNVIDE